MLKNSRMTYQKLASFYNEIDLRHSITMTSYKVIIVLVDCKWMKQNILKWNKILFVFTHFQYIIKRVLSFQLHKIFDGLSIMLLYRKKGLSSFVHSSVAYDH